MGPTWNAYEFGYPHDGPTCFRIMAGDRYSGDEIARTSDYSRVDCDNAHVMAAAPDLLAALEVLVEAIDCHCLTTDDLPFDVPIEPVPPCQWHKAKAAIAKARGEVASGIA